MNAFLNTSVSARRVARVIGTLTALLLLFGLEFSSTRLAAHRANFFYDVGILMVFIGCIVGWFKDLAAALLILGGFLIILVTVLAFPASRGPVYFYTLPAIPGVFFLYAYLTNKKK